MKRNNFFLSILVVIIIIISFTGCGNNASSSKTSQKNQPTTRTITNMSGEKVKIPTNIQKIGDSWPAHNEVLSMLGSGEKIVATVLTPRGRPWLYKVNPQMNKSETVFTAADVNVEELLKTKPDIVFMPSSYKYSDKITSAGIPVVQLNFTNYEELKSCFKLTGDILGTEAKQKATKYNSYLDSKLKMVTDITSIIPKNQKPKVLHISSLSPLAIDGSSSIIDAWINAAGGTNVAGEIKGNMKVVSMEQVLKWNPDVIILGADTKNSESVMSSDGWEKVTAVQKGKVVHNPDGAYMWDRYSAEEALQIQWAAKLLHPDKFNNLDIVKETMNFYKEFLNYNLTKEEANLIISGNPPTKAQ
ncbi:ABC transporter substrate-binding protein [Clostridium estertheticum]|uniref:ABC transporter substrate-binding protein n=1 Tax=Clostridium estertheticum TaxID=238834 RepID=UPI0013EE49B6|nr:ABC transporter substrate-binding protein [Clostridium estertheticum]MBZ9606992.1 ABC transporter substrate-binding protein [Clostridium estertheticum]